MGVRGAIIEVPMQQSIHVLTRRAAGSRNGEEGGDCSPSQKGQGDEGHVFKPELTSDDGGYDKSLQTPEQKTGGGEQRSDQIWRAS